MEINNILQGLVHSFNEGNTRSRIMRRCVKRFTSVSPLPSVEWKGSYEMTEDDERFPHHLKWEWRKGVHYLFTLRYVCRNGSAHYIACILDVSHKQLTVFDPGHGLYTDGTRKLIPILTKELRSYGIIDKKVVLKTSCVISGKDKASKSRGIQYNGLTKHPFPADAYCQMWTLFFLCTFVEHGCDTSFFKKWCDIPPYAREHFLLSSFALPVLQCDSVFSKDRRHVKTVVPMLKTYTLDRFWTSLK